MKKLLLVAVMLISSVMFSQTSVTLQVTDADSQTWNNGTYTVTLSSLYQTLPQPVNGLVSSALNGTGGASITLQAGTYTFDVCPAAASYGAGVYGNLKVGCYSSSVAISGGSQTVTLAPAAIRIPLKDSGMTVRAYADAEVTNAFTGAQYFNLVSNSNRQWNGTAWVDPGMPSVVTFSTLPTCNSGNEGMRRSISDASSVATWGANAAGSGSNHAGVYCDGTNWTLYAK